MWHRQIKNAGETRTNCKNCGAEYIVDELGRLTDFKIKILVQGVVKEFYVGCFEVYPLDDGIIGRLLDGTIVRHPVCYKTKLNLIEI